MLVVEVSMCHCFVPTARAALLGAPSLSEAKCFIVTTGTEFTLWASGCVVEVITGDTHLLCSTVTVAH